MNAVVKVCQIVLLRLLFFLLAYFYHISYFFCPVSVYELLATFHLIRVFLLLLLLVNHFFNLIVRTIVLQLVLVDLRSLVRANLLVKVIRHLLGLELLQLKRLSVLLAHVVEPSKTRNVVHEVQQLFVLWILVVGDDRDAVV